MAKPNFIGVDNMTVIANRVNTQVIMGPAYARPEEMDRLKILITSGIQYKDTKYVMNRKGGTTRRKVVGEPIANKAGYLDERPLVTQLCWNMYYDNKDNYRETPFPTEDGVSFTYPLSELAMEAVLMNYAEDLYLNLWWGSVENDRKTNPRSLYDGFHTLRLQDIDAGRISTARGNLITVDVIDFNTPENLLKSFDVFEDFYIKWNPALRSVPVMLYCSDKLSTALQASYAHRFNGNSKVTPDLGKDGMPNGNWHVTEYPRVTFAPSSEYGNGTKMIATVPFNFEYGVDSEDSRNEVSVRVGSDDDHNNISFQVQSVSGCRIINPNPNAYVESTGTLTVPDSVNAGDYQKDTYTVSVNDDSMGTVTVDGNAPDNSKEYASGTLIALVATPKTGYDFVKWSDGVTVASRNVIAKGQPDAVVAIFKTHTA